MTHFELKLLHSSSSPSTSPRPFGVGRLCPRPSLVAIFHIPYTLAFATSYRAQSDLTIFHFFPIFASSFNVCSHNRSCCFRFPSLLIARSNHLGTHTHPATYILILCSIFSSTAQKSEPLPHGCFCHTPVRHTFWPHWNFRTTIAPDASLRSPFTNLYFTSFLKPPPPSLFTNYEIHKTLKLAPAFTFPINFFILHFLIMYNVTRRQN